MDKLMKINQVATKYSITKRTLRYYEEIGLLATIKKDHSNYRYYGDDQLMRLEQILLLREIDFNLSEIKNILLSDDDQKINKIFTDKLTKIQSDINNLLYFKRVVESIIKIREEKGAAKINLQEVLKEQIYATKKFERMIKMSQYVEETIMIEFGINICGYCDELISNIKKLRSELENKYNKEIPLMRMKDNLKLKENEYKISIRGITVKSEELLENEGAAERIIINLEKAIESNIEKIY